MRRTSERYRLLGRYSTPRFRYGQKVECEIRGELTIVALRDAPIPWPVGKSSKTGRWSIVVYKGLAKAVRRESDIAVQHWWGVSPSTVGLWRKALGVPANNEGTRSRRRAVSSTPSFRRKVLKKAWAKARDPERVAKIAAARRGKKRPAEHMEAARQANLGRKLSAEHRRKLSAAQRRRGTRPPKAGVSWTAAEDALLHKLSPAEVARRTGRTLQACYARRKVLGLSDGRRLRWVRAKGSG